MQLPCSPNQEGGRVVPPEIFQFPQFPRNFAHEEVAPTLPSSNTSPPRDDVCITSLVPTTATGPTNGHHLEEQQPLNYVEAKLTNASMQGAYEPLQWNNETAALGTDMLTEPHRLNELGEQLGKDGVDMMIRLFGCH